MRLSRPALLIILFVYVTLLAPAALAQIPSASDTTSTPAPGAHNYLGSPVETVNPANGSASIRIPVRMPPGRQLTMPFSFAYDTNGAFYMGSNPIHAGGPQYLSLRTSIGSVGGWSYSYPVMSFYGGTWTIPGSLDHLITCHGSTNYVFQDPNGNRHNLGLSVSPDVASPDGYDNCNAGLDSDGEFTTGQEGPLIASTSIPTINNGTFPAVYVTDGHGASYSFPGGGPGTTGITELATGLSDRNGNTLTITIPVAR